MGRKPAPAWVKPAALGGILILVTLLAGSRLGSLPPLAKFFNPWFGFWRNAEAGGIQGGELRLAGLREPVTVAFDTRGVPHIFAQNAHDLFFAQGFVTARDRLWQMEAQTHAAAGRLAEFLGPEFVERDRFQRRLGMLQGAERALEAMKKNEESWSAAEAYSAGVNAHIGSLNPARLPLEYKLLGYLPERWTPLKTALLIKHMQWTLSGMGDDLPMTNTFGKFGPEFMERFFPRTDPEIPPVIPPGTAWAPVRDSVAAPGLPSLLPGDTSAWFDPSTGLRMVPRPADSIPPAAAGPGDTARIDSLRRDSAQPHEPLPVPALQPSPGNGSNNFVVAGSRTSTGLPILANDPHLDLGLPSIWYEVQLTAPGINAYGASLAGAPAVVIGFNKSIAWGMTNGHDDVFDWYRMEFRDSTLAEYLFAGDWRATRSVVEAIKVRGGKTVLDTVVYTHHGPVALKTREKPRNRNTPSQHALRWLALDHSDELMAFLRIMRATDYAGFYAALETYHCPSQNFAFASASGDIAMEHHGRFPKKWRGQGRYTLVGAEPGHDWQGWVPRAENPRARNPAQGWLASANQVPTDTSYPHDLGWGHPTGRRSLRVHQLVADADSLTPEEAGAIMLDDLNLHAAAILPEMLRRLNANGLSPADSAAREALVAWDFRHRPQLHAPAVFDQWWRLLYRAIWQDEFAGDSVRYQWPSKDRTRRLILEEPGEEWFDDISTPARENLNSLVNRTFRDACARLRRQLADPTWAAYRPVRIQHLARLDALGHHRLAAGGCHDCVNALRATHGPSLRLVVALGRQGPRAWGVYPGGQSGNPGSPRYDDMVKDWSEGRLHELVFLNDLRERPELTPVRLQLEGN